MKQGMKTKKKEQQERTQGTFKKWLLVLAFVGVITAGACGQSSTPSAESVPAAAAETTIAADVATEAPPTSLTETTAETATDSAIAETIEAEAVSVYSDDEREQASVQELQAFNLSAIPAYSGEPYVAVNNNVPYFTDADLTNVSFEDYSDLDSAGRCGTAYASVCTDTMPTEKRGGIGSVKPTGWHTVKYDHVDGKYLYNRCHLIGYQLTAENANEKNLITGTRYLNVQGMLPFENMTADYIKETGNHVMYRVTPVFEGDNLVASGVLMEAKSVENQGEGILFCVYVYNVQPGVSIDYATGDSTATEGVDSNTGSSSTGNSSASNATAQAQAAASQTQPQTETLITESPETTVTAEPVSTTYILNTNTKKFHYPSCSAVKQMKDSNKEEFSGSRDEVIDQGYVPCKKCNS